MATQLFTLQTCRAFCLDSRCFHPAARLLCLGRHPPRTDFSGEDRQVAVVYWARGFSGLLDTRYVHLGEVVPLGGPEGGKGRGRAVGEHLAAEDVGAGKLRRPAGRALFLDEVAGDPLAPEGVLRALGAGAELDANLPGRGPGGDLPRELSVKLAGEELLGAGVP
eukprot:CAMPEP_0113948392 /NCGR_PEP_ID=MMETSP1339-20121228/70106_1 /TAXON_ID=94617 /ORGANISM="Fibrocapsa japonica" /LENGTH=164 /DNA_ID=CAMNT_0000955441 /DNA_START=356 /DNA_END=846 /DNA_ORIENTATION=+ /assembly_acc=CAM_ASM_000762